MRMRRRLTALLLGLSLTLTLAPTAAAQSGYEDAIAAACARYGCDAGYLVSIMLCESGGNPDAVGAQGETGLFQIKDWIWHVGTDPYAQIDFAARMISAGRTDLWLCA